MNSETGNPFLRFHALGYTRLVPVIPPGCEVSPKSTFAKRLKAGKDPRGKAPGVKGEHGWRGIDFTKVEAELRDLEVWDRMGASVGLKLGRGLVFVDVDTLKAEWAAAIKAIFEKHLGTNIFWRVGNYPKAGFMVLTDSDYAYCCVEFGDRDEHGRLTSRVEILCEGRQFVAHGIHPVTGKPYRWPTGVPPRGDLIYVPAATLDAILAEIAAAMPAAEAVKAEGNQSAEPVDPATLKGDPETIERAVKAMRNTAGREQYVAVGYALKGALPDDPALAFELYSDWCERWEDGDNEPDMVAAEWSRMNLPPRIGAQWLYDRAHEWSGGSFTPHFDPEAAARANETTGESLFPPEEKTDDPGAHIRATQWAPVEPAALPPRQWLYGHHYIRQFISATVAPSGVGKTALTLIEFLAMASGKPLLGVQPHGQFKVWLWNGEDPRDELNLRIAAAMMHYGLTAEDIGDRLFVDTGREMEIVMAVEGRDGAKIVAPVAGAVEQVIRDNGIDVMGVDPFVSSHRVSENDNGGIDLVAKRWAKIAGATGTAIELVHHVRKLNGGEVSVEDSRGAVALMAAARPKRALAAMTKSESVKLGVEGSRHRFFRVGDERNNLALPAGDETAWFELVSVAVGNGAGETAVEKMINGDSVGVVTVGRVVEAGAAAGVADDTVGTALRMVREGVWRRDVRAGDAWIGVPIAHALQLDVEDPVDKARVKQIVSAWIRGGRLVEVSRKDDQRHTRTYVEAAVSDEMSGETPSSDTDTLSDSVFE